MTFYWDTAQGFTYSWVGFPAPWPRGAIVTETVDPAKLKISTFWPLTENVCLPPDNTTYYRHHRIKDQFDTEKVNTVSPERRPVLKSDLDGR